MDHIRSTLALRLRRKHERLLLWNNQLTSPSNGGVSHVCKTGLGQCASTSSVKVADEVDSQVEEVQERGKISEVSASWGCDLSVERVLCLRLRGRRCVVELVAAKVA